MTIATKLKQLYETDENLWLEETIELLKQKQFNQLDLENLIEELISLGRRDLAKAKSVLRQSLFIYYYFNIGRLNMKETIVMGLEKLKPLDMT
ncbi:DUF29 family protein [Nostoc sp.]|uniref:DUF29 family protein n=1 Tax=Nostoc sp. TaxID=1180 RepID=UPI002FFCFFCD